MFLNIFCFRTGSLVLQINVLDVNDNAPKFEHLTYDLSLPTCNSFKNFPIDQSVLKINAIDIDSNVNGFVMYQILHTIDDLPESRQCAKIISINKTSGDVFYNVIFFVINFDTYNLNIKLFLAIVFSRKSR